MFFASANPRQWVVDLTAVGPYDDALHLRIADDGFTEVQRGSYCTKPRHALRLKSEELRHLRYLVQRLAAQPPQVQKPDEPDGYHYQVKVCSFDDPSNRHEFQLPSPIVDPVAAELCAFCRSVA